MAFRYWSESEKAPLAEMIREHGVETIVALCREIYDANGGGPSVRYRTPGNRDTAIAPTLVLSGAA